MRQSLTAGYAPGCPEVHQDDLALQVIERDAMAISGGDGKRRRHSGAGQFGLADVAQGALAVEIVLRAHLHEELELGLGSLILL